MARYPAPEDVDPCVWEQFSALAERARCEKGGFTEIDVAEQLGVDRATARELMDLLATLSRDDPEPAQHWYKESVVLRRVWFDYRTENLC